MLELISSNPSRHLLVGYRHRKEEAPRGKLQAKTGTKVRWNLGLPDAAWLSDLRSIVDGVGGLV